MQQRIMAGLVFALVGISAWAAGDAPSSPPEGWEQYVQPGGAYAMWVPKRNRTLVEQQGTLRLKDASVKYTVLECKIKNDVKIDVMVMNLPLKKGERIDATTIHELLRDLKIKDVHGKLAGESDTAVGTFPGKEYRINYKLGKQVRMRVFFGGVTVYQISAAGTKKQVEGKSANTVFDSFKLSGGARTLLKKQAPPKK